MPLIAEELQRQVREVVRRHGLVVWFDPTGTYTRFVDDLAARPSPNDFPHPVIGFRGSYLDLLYATAPHMRGIDRTPLLVHLAGVGQTEVANTPALELARAGGQFEPDLKELVQKVASGRVAPEALKARLTDPTLALETADEWLAAALRGRDGLLEGRLAPMSAEAFLDELVAARETVCGVRIDAAVVAAVLDHAHRQLGVSGAWRQAWTDTRDHSGPEDLLRRETRALLSWALAVEYVHDLRREPLMDDLRPLKSVPHPLVATCCRLAVHARERHTDAYLRVALELEDRLVEERTRGQASDLGSIDTMRFEAELLLSAAIEEVTAGRGQKAREWAEARRPESFWLRQNVRLGAAWELVGLAASCLHAIDTHAPTLQGIDSLDEAVDWYMGGLWQVDQAHRRLLQRAAVLLEPELPFYAQIREALRKTRQAWRKWADALAKRFSQLCRQHGFLPSDARQQRTLFEQVVRPRADEGKAAFVVVDALRYEMAEELRRALSEAGATVTLQSRLSELPSDTSVGMNALAPVATAGTLAPVLQAGKFKGFRTGEFTVNDPDSRVRAMFLRVGGRKLPRVGLEEACTVPPAELKPRISGAPLVFVDSRAIDDAGEAGLGVEHFERELQRLVIACRNLQTAGIRQFVITADHGFLLQDETARVIPYGRTIDPSRRHVWSPDIHDQNGLVTAPLSALGYTGVEGCLLMPEDTGVFDRGPGNRANFVHGGGSLQERVIPVLTAVFPGGQDDSLVACAVEATTGEPLGGMLCLKIRVQPAAGAVALPFAEPTLFDIHIRAPRQPNTAVAIKHVRPEIRREDGRLRLPMSVEATEVFFTLTAEIDGRVALEVVASDAGREVALTPADGLFTVIGRQSAAQAAGQPVDLDWVERLPDEARRKVALHLVHVGRATEADLLLLLGTPRAVRLFALQFESFQNACPFPVSVAATDEGKVYERV